MAPVVSNSPALERLRVVKSRQNTRVKELRRLFHEGAPSAKNEVAIEGMHLLEEAIRSSLKISAVFVAESAGGRAAKLLPQISQHTETLLLPDEVFFSAVPTDTPQGVAALVQVRKHSLAEAMKRHPSLVLLAAGLQDPGNLGTIVRSAEAFAATGLLLGEQTVGPWNWKAVRASAGSMFRVPTVKVGASAAIGELKAHGVRVVATSSHKGASIAEADFRGDVALIIGNEGSGVGKQLLAQADEVVAIPHLSSVESLNAAIAASIVLYEAFRQRREAK